MSSLTMSKAMVPLEDDSSTSGDDFATETTGCTSSFDPIVTSSSGANLDNRADGDSPEVTASSCTSVEETTSSHSENEPSSRPITNTVASASNKNHNATTGTKEPRRRPQKKSMDLSFSMHSPRTPRRYDAVPRSKSFTSASRRIHEVDGMPLKHWDKSNFETKRDETCRLVYEPKDGKEFFHKNLPMEDYEVMRSISLEQPYYSKYNRFFPKRGHFCCKACGNALYSHAAKFDAEDGWPAFGACVEGAIGVIPSEKRRAQIEREDEACVKMQAFIRGALSRIRVTEMLEGLIQQMLEQRHRRQKDDMVDDASKTDTAVTTIDFKVKSPHFSSNMVKQKINKTKTLRYTLLRALGDDYTEIHCHRCKSHLGDVMEEENVGKNGKEFQERHRVNGRALKYVEDDLPKRIMVESSLLFADPARRRLWGLPSPKKKVELESSLRTAPFVSPRAQRRRLLSSNGIAADPLSVSCHATVQGGGMSRRKRIGFDPLSATSHEPARMSQTNDLFESRDQNGDDPLKPSAFAHRKGKFRATNMQQKRASLEQFILSKSMH